MFTHAASRLSSSRSAMRSAAARSGRLVKTRSVPMDLFYFLGLAEVRRAHARVLEQPGRGARERDRARLEHVGAARELEREARVLLDEEDGHALARDVAHDLEDAADHQRRKPH